MSFGKVEDWLRSLGLICYAQAFYDNGYEDIDTCEKIGEDDLDVIGVKNEKDRNDIIASVHRLNQKQYYFELEPEDLFEHAKPEKTKFDPLLLKSMIKDELEKRNIQLTEPPYFLLNGSLGDLTSLAEILAFDLNTFADDVKPALEQIRRRQFPAETYAALMNELEENGEEKVQNGIKGQPNSHDLQEYLNVETGMRPRRATSLSKYDKRITKSTSNLNEADTSSDHKVPVISHFKGKQKKHGLAKKSSHGFGKIFSSMRRTKSPMLEVSVRKSSSSDLNAGDISVPQDELVSLMRKVKHKEMSQEEALAEVQRRSGARAKSKSFDGESTGCIFDSSPEVSPKETEAPRHNKKKDGGKSKKKRQGKKIGQNSVFYNLGGNNEDDACQQVQLVKISGSPGTVPAAKHDDKGSSNHHSDDSPELSSFSRNNSNIVGKFKRSFRKTGRSPNVDDSDAFPSTETLNSSAGSNHSSSQDSIVSTELQDSVTTGTDPRATGQLGVKPGRKPPPIPVREDMLLRTSKPLAANQHQLVTKPSKSAPIPPPRKSSAGQTDSRTETRPQAERARSVTFNEVFSTRETDGTASCNTEGRLSGSTSSTVSSTSSTNSPILKSGSHTLDGKGRAIPRPLPRSFYRKDSNDSLQGDGNEAMPIAPPRLKKIQGKLQNIPATGVDEQVSEPANPSFSTETKGITSELNSMFHKGQDIVMTSKSHLSTRNSQEKTVSEEDVVPPLLSSEPKGRPTLKPKPQLPPRPISTVGVTSEGSAVTSPTASKPRVPRRGDLSSQGELLTNNNTAPALWSTDEAKVSPPDAVKPLRARPLKDLIKKKLRKESIEITSHPYTTEDGKWNIPYALVQRYSEELERSFQDVVSALDTIRTTTLTERGATVVPCEAKAITEHDVVSTSLSSSVDEWLIQQGLPMFSEDFREVGLTTFSALKTFPESDFKNIGVYDQRHIRRLLEEIKKL